MKPPADRIEHPVAFFLHGIGDAVLVLPALRAMAHAFPGWLTLLCERGVHELLFRDLHVGRVVHLDDHLPEPAGEVRDPRDLDLDAVGLAVATGRCDVFFALVPWRSRSLNQLVRLLRPAGTVGLAEGWTRSVPRDRSRHAFCQAFDVARHVRDDLSLERFAQPALLPAEATAAARRIVAAFPAGARLVVLHGETAAHKRARPDQLRAAVAALLAADARHWVLLVDRSGAGTVDWLADDRLIPCGRLPLAVCMALVASAHLFVGVDSCMLHVADLARTPGIGLFAATGPEEFGFRFSAGRHIRDVGTRADLARQVLAMASELRA